MKDLLKPWERISRKVVYNSFLKVVRDEVLLPNGKNINYDSIDQKDCSCVLIVTDEDKVLLLRQYRYVIDEVTWEIPMGGVQDDETNEQAARREVMEETGFELNELIYLGFIVPSNGQSPQKMHLYFGRGEKKNDSNQEDSEFLETHLFNLNEIINMINKGMITDAATLTALLLSERKQLLK